MKEWIKSNAKPNWTNVYKLYAIIELNELIHRINVYNKEL